MKNFTSEEMVRFNAKWKKKGDCHMWLGALDKDGYGTFFFRRLNRRAHRVAWYGSKGDIPSGLVVNHTCRNRNCVNPSHLQAITATENNLRDSSSVGYINSQKTSCPKGHAYDRKYGKQRYCSICEAEKTRRLRKKWKEEDVLNI
jgi:hypothetical protein